MTLVDTNVLLYASFADTPEHEAARAWLSARFADPDEPVVLCWPVLYALVRLLSSRRAFAESAVTVGRAWAIASTMVRHPGTRLIEAGPGHEAIASELAATPGLRSDDVPDIQIASLAIEHGLVLATHDHGFGRFRSLRWLDPLT